MAHRDLSKAKKGKDDEFYTQLTDIEKECKHYKEHFKGKTIFCNCDDPYWSNFFYYFIAKFNDFGLKKLISTHYKDNGLPLFADIKPENPYKITVTKVSKDLLKLPVEAMVTHIIAENGGRVPLKGDGDFRSNECIELLKESDIVITNPPFSLFREFVDLIMDHNKKFLIIGNTNAITYKNVFKYIKENRIWAGVSTFNQGLYFIVPDSLPCQKIENGKRLVRVSSVCWYTNLQHQRQNDSLILTERYSNEKFPKYDNYDAIEVSTWKAIPKDYKGVMGVPITFLDKYNPSQFEIIGTSDNGIIDDKYKTTQGLRKKFVDDYYKAGGKGSYKEGNPTAGLYVNGVATMIYKRLFIKNRNPE